MHTSPHCARHSEVHQSQHTLQHNAGYCNILQRTATHCNNLLTAHNILRFTSLNTHYKTRQHTAANCNTLQHTAAHCNTLQHTATHCNTLQQLTAQDVVRSNQYSLLHFECHFFNLKSQSVIQFSRSLLPRSVERDQ